MPDQHRGGVERVEGSGDGIHVVLEGDAGAVGVARLETGKRQGVDGVAGVAQRGGHLVPRVAVEPETGDEHDVHALTVCAAADMGRGLWRTPTGPRSPLPLGSQVVVRCRSFRGFANERGDVPGWVLITLMTAGLVILIWALAGPALSEIFQNAIAKVTGL